MKIVEIEKTGKEFMKYYTEEKISEIPPQGIFRNGVVLRVVNKDGTYQGIMRFPNDRRIQIEQDVIKNYIDTLEKENKEYDTKIINSNERRIGNNIVFISSINGTGGKYLYIMAPLSPVDATVNVLKSQLLLITLILIIISFILSLIISIRISKPIIRIKNTALNFARGNYDIRFEEGSYNEINELSDVLNHTAKELTKNEELRRDLIANVSHDLKTPLTIIKSYAEMIGDISGDNKEKREEHLKVIVDETDRLTLLVDDILDLSKMEAGTVEFEMEKFNLSETVTGIYEKFRVFSEFKNYNFVIDCPDNIIVTGNEKRITQVIYNLVGNAVNYTGEDKTIKIAVEKKENVARFEVTDTGKGISNADIKRVWNRYYKSSNTNGREPNGSGIGLAIVKNILEIHNVDYGIISKEGYGATFWFELTLGADNNEEN